MRIYAGRALLSAILGWFSLTGACAAQAFLFVSPSTRDHMSDEAAVEALTSFEQNNFVAVASYLARRLCSKPQVRSTEGIYAGTAENGSLITGCRSGPAAYLGDLLGRYAHQKWVLVFDPSPTGSQHLFVVAIPGKRATGMLKELRQYGIADASMVQEDRSVRIYLWVRDGSQDAALHSLAESEHGTLQDLPGTGTLMGNDDRAAAQRIFARYIRAYERAHHRSLSKLLWSEWLHDLAIARVSTP